MGVVGVKPNIVVSLEVVLGKLFSIVENKEAAPTLQRQAFRYIYLLSKVCTPGTVYMFCVRWHMYCQELMSC